MRSILNPPPSRTSAFDWEDWGRPLGRAALALYCNFWLTGAWLMGSHTGATALSWYVIIKVIWWSTKRRPQIVTVVLSGPTTAFPNVSPSHSIDSN